MATESHELPAQLLQAVADRAGRIALVVGAGCSLEQPTSLELSDTYAQRVHGQLVLNGILSNGECTAPNDLSVVASTVWAKVQSQESIVKNLPRGEFRDAQANDGYLIAAALLREGAVSAVLTLNFDLAMSNALGQLSANDEVAVIADPVSLGDLGSRVVIYLHRNVNESDCDNWILRVEALTDAWRGGWEEVISQRVLTSPVIVFAGLGSPAAVLTESIKWIRARIDTDHHHAYVVDPSATTKFKDAVELPTDAHIKMGWGDFMRRLAERLSAQMRIALEESCNELCTSNSWPEEVEFISDSCGVFFDRGLVASGKQRARWLLHKSHYVPDGEHVRAFIAYLLLGVGLIRRHSDTSLTIRQDGVVELRRDGRVIGSCLPVSGEGTHHWSAIEPRVNEALKRMASHELPTAILIAGLQGPSPSHVTPPENVGYEVADGDIASGRSNPVHITVDDVRADPTLAQQMVA
jgi:hypothetical protein